MFSPYESTSSGPTINLSQDFRPRAVEMGYPGPSLLMNMSDKQELNAYMKNEWKNDRSWLANGPDCCPDGEGIVSALKAKLREVARDLDETYGQIACCL
jgi:hypothetical protein